MSAHRRYTDDEVHAIFERAAVRQEEAKKAEDASRSGLSLEELQQIGSEAGIDPAHVALAASEVTVGGQPISKRKDESVLGFPSRLGTSRVIRGQVSDEQWERMVLELREIFGRDGIAGELGKVREWTVTSSVGKFDKPVKVTLRPEGDDTLVTIGQELKGQALGFSIGGGIYATMGLVFILINALTRGDGPPFAVGLMFLALAVVFFGGAQIGTRMYAGRQQTKFGRALDRIELVARELRALERKPEEAIPEIDLEALPDASETDSESLRRRERERD